MKKFMLTLLAAVGFAAAANAQAGSILVFGFAGIDLDKDTAETTRGQLEFSPGVGYQFDDHWTLGLALSAKTRTVKPDGGDRTSVNNFRVGPFVRYTQPLGNIFSVFGQAGAGFQFGSTRFDGETIDGSKHSGAYFNFFPAVGVNVYKGFALNFAFGGLDFETDKFEDADNSSSSFNVSFGQQFNVGISKNFGGRHMRNHREPGDDTRNIDTSDDEDDMPRKKKARRGDD